MSDSNSRLIRRAAVLVLYAIDSAEVDESDALDTIPGTLTDEFGSRVGQVWDDVTLAVHGVQARIEELNAEIQAVSPRWKVERMAPVDRTILRVGAWEILHAEHPPLEVINACVDLAKEYGEKTTPAFINGLLDQLCQNHDITIS